MSIDKAIENIMEGKLDEMRENLSAALTVKAAAKLDERKIEIAENYFGLEQLDELSRKTLNSYIKKSFKDENELQAQAISMRSGTKKHDKIIDKRNNRSQGRRDARARLKGSIRANMKYGAKE